MSSDLQDTNMNNLESIEYKDSKITFNCINEFCNKNRSENDSNNKKRENIIVCIINNKIPEEYYIKSSKWYDLKKKLDIYINNLCKIKDITQIDNIYCIPKAGRSNHYDFKIIINNDKEYNIEFKFGASCVNDTPQFVSPGKPSKYLISEFESWFFDNFLDKIAKFGNLELPNKEEYCKTIHNNNVECMKEFKEKYKSDINFNNYCKKIDKEAIKLFIQSTEIDMNKLSSYLIESQKDKHYMCYNNGEIYYDTLDDNIYKLSELLKKNSTNYIYKTDNGMKLQILLRFKNGCGLLFPALQISRKIPTVKELKNICKENNINIEGVKLKKDILTILNKNKVIY
jgi:hypothetical protein